MRAKRSNGNSEHRVTNKGIGSDKMSKLVLEIEKEISATKSLLHLKFIAGENFGRGKVFIIVYYLIVIL